MHHSPVDKLHHSGGKCPPLPALGGPWSAAGRTALAESAWPPGQQDAVTNRAGSTSNILCWSRCGDILLWWPGSGVQGAVEWYGCRYLAPAGGRRRRASSNAE